MPLRSAIRRIGAASLALAMVAGSFGAGAFTPRSHAASSVTVTIWYPWGGPDGGQIVNWAKAYSQANPGVTINPVLVSGSGIDPTVTSGGKFLAAVKGGNAPDAALYWGQNALPSLAKLGAVQPLDMLLTAAGIKTGVYPPAALSAMKYNGSVYGLPEMTNVRELLWNKDLFKKAGLDPNVYPKTTAQLDAMAAKLTVITNGKVEQLGFVPWAEQGGPDVLSGLFGASYFDAKGNPDLNNPGMLKLLTWEASYVSKYGAGPVNSFLGSFNTQSSQANDPFVKGGIAMMIGGEWEEGFLSLYAPKLNYGVAPMPAPAGRPYPASLLDGNTWFIPKGSKNAAEALKFIAWTQDPARNAAGADYVHNISPIVAAQPMQKLNADPIFKVALGIAQHAHLYSQVSSPYLLTIESTLNTAFQTVQQGQASPADALATAQSSTMRIISQ